MSLPALNARLTVQNTVAVGAPNEVSIVLDGLYALLRNAGGAFPAYMDGTLRTPGTFAAEEIIGNVSPALNYGSGSALTGSTWTWTREQAAGKTVAIIGAPPSTATTFGKNTRLIIAGNVGGTAPKIAPTMGGSDSAGANQLWIGLVKNVIPGVSVYNGWSNVNPWVGCLFGGYINLTSPTTDTSRWNTSMLLRVYETQETCWVQITTGATAQKTWTGYGGALVDSETVNPADYETDQRLYCYGASGGEVQSVTCLRDYTGFGLLLHEAGGTGYPHFLSYNPGAATVQSLFRVFNSNASSLNLVTRDGSFPRIGGFHVSNSNNWAGRLREIQVVRDGLSQQVFGSGPTIHGYTLGYSPTLTGDCVLLQY